MICNLKHTYHTRDMVFVISLFRNKMPYKNLWRVSQNSNQAKYYYFVIKTILANNLTNIIKEDLNSPDIIPSGFIIFPNLKLLYLRDLSRLRVQERKLNNKTKEKFMFYVIANRTLCLLALYYERELLLQA